METAITNARILTMADGGIGAISDGAIGIDDGKIVFVGPTSEFDPTDAAECIDGRNRLVIPGLIDAHAHMRLTLLRGGA